MKTIPKLRLAIRRAASRSMRYRGMLVLVLWQVPVQPVLRPDGSIGFMLGGGGDEHAELSCEGDLLSSEKVRYRTVAVDGDYNLTPRVRIAGVAGAMGSDWDSHSGAFAAFQLRSDWKYVGVGGGLALTPTFDQWGSGSAAWPSAYVRGGSADGAHARVDLYPPSVFGGQQIMRLGIGFNAVNRDEPSGFAGVAVLGHGEASTGVAAELTIPVANRLAVRMGGHAAGGHEHPVFGLAAGGTLLLGGRGAASATSVQRAPPP